MAIQFLSGLGTPLPQHQLAFVPVQLRYEPAFSGPCDNSQAIIQQRHGFFDLASYLACLREEGNVMGHKYLRPCSAVGARTAAEERYPLRHITIFDLDPS